MPGSVIVNDGTKDGIKFIEDTGDYVNPSINMITGVNSTIVFQNLPVFKREITVECRSEQARDNLMLALMDPDGVIIDGEQYVVLTVNPVESFGIGDSNPIQVWTYRIELVMA